MRQREQASRHADSSLNLVMAAVISSSAGQPYLLNKSRCATSTSSLPPLEILTLIGRSSTCVADTSESGKTFLINRVAASASCAPPSQLAQ